MMNPEIQEIQAKYRDKRDSASMAKMNEETKAVYAKYGTSPTGGCLTMIIQLPIMFALYRVIYKIPGYVSKIKALFVNNGNGIADQVIEEPFGGAHRDFKKAAEFLGKALEKHLTALRKFAPEKLRKQRYDKFRAIGNFVEAAEEETVAEEK